jgi:hypothetical protein
MQTAPLRGRPAASSLVAGIALAVATALVFWPALQNGFIELFDDNVYVTSNPVVLQGLTADGLRWAFTTVHSHTWHPLTSLSHMADVSMFGLDPRGHHLASVLVHAVVAALVLALLRAARVGLATSLIAAAAFALHPLRVESVAWVSERKDVLCVALSLGTALAWLRFGRTGDRRAYAAALVLFLLALLAKPMAVSIPAVLLLLDLWPLGRAERSRAWPLVVEKVPFAGIAAAVALATFVAQRASGAVQDGSRLPLSARLANAAVVPFLYLGKTVWPSDLSVFYPHTGAETPVAVALGAALLLVAATAAAWRLRRHAPWLLVGWGWFLVTLLPVIGLVQVGRQGMADRYTYLPSVGLVLALAAGAEAALGATRRRWASAAAAALAVACVVALAVATRSQLAVWRDSRSLFLHARAVTDRNSVAANALGVLQARAGDLEGAARLYAEAVAFDPGSAVARQNFAGILLALGRPDEALPEGAEAVRLDPSNPQAHFVHGIALALGGRLTEAAAELETAIALRPDYANARAALADVRARLGR